MPTTVAKCELEPGDALLAVDVQHDFLPGGALGIANGDRVIAPLNQLIERFARSGLPVFATRDWHPPDHCSFHARGGPWPPHCIQGTRGAEFTPALRLPRQVEVVSKATTKDAEAYSAFSGTGLAAALRAAQVRRIFIGGLATDYCVVESTLDAVREGFEVVVVDDAVCAVEANAGDGARALERMRRAGAMLVPSRGIGA